MAAGPWTLGVDIGTSFTTAAIGLDGEVELLEIDHSRYLPSTVYMDFEGTLLVGRPALAEAAQFPDRAERLPKRALVRSSHVRLGGVTASPVDLVAAILRKVAAHATTQMGSAPGRLLLTHPAAWTQPQLNLLGEAAARADLPAPELVPEPIGAAVWYANATPVPEGAHVAVYDLGGGTFDTAVLRRTGDGFELASPPGGDPNFGGEDLDEILMEVLAGHAQAIDPGPWAELWAAADRRARRDLSQLRRDVTEAKESLSDRTTCRLYVPGYERELRVTRGELEAAAQDPIQATLAELRRTVERAGLAVADLAGVFLAGGASRMPCVSDLLTQALGVMPAAHGDPKTVVVLGAMMAPALAEVSTAPDRVVASTPPQPDVSESIASFPTLAPTLPPTGDLAFRLARTLTGHTGLFDLGVNGVAFSPDGRLLASAGADKTVRLWDLATGQERATLSGHRSGVNCVAFSPDGHLLASGGAADDTRGVRLWDPVTGQDKTPMTTGSAVIYRVAFSPDGGLLATATSRFVWLWDPATGQLIQTLTHGQGRVHSVAFSPNGQLLASAGEDMEVVLWVVGKAGEPMDTLTGHATASRRLGSPSRRRPLRHVASLVLGDRPFRGEVKDVAFSPDGRLLASAGNDSLRLWDCATGKERAKLTGHTGWVRIGGFGPRVKAVAFSPVGKLLASAAADKMVRLWDPATGEQRATLEGHTDRFGEGVNCVAFSRDGRLLASGGADKTVRLWELVGPSWSSGRR